MTDEKKMPPGAQVWFCGIDWQNVRDRGKWFWVFGGDGYADSEDAACLALQAAHDESSQPVVLDFIERAQRWASSEACLAAWPHADDPREHFKWLLQALHNEHTKRKTL